MEMNYCMHCGTRLTLRPHGAEGELPYCEGCGAFRHPVFNIAVSMVVTDEGGEKILLIRQYGRPHYILVAGYVERGEDAEETCARELREELGLTALRVRFNRSRYFAPSNTLMLNYTVTVSKDEPPRPNGEIDDWRWFSIEQARGNIRPGSLASAFLNGYLTGTYEFCPPPMLSS